MRILVLAPMPFFQVRGSPIDVDILVRALSMRPDTRIDLSVYGEGEDRAYPHLAIHRAAMPPLVRGIRPGFSFKKLLCDVPLFFKVWSLVRRNRYDVIHATEEGAFIGLFFRIFYGIPYVYDLDSSIAQQLVESRPWLRPAMPLFDALEGLAVRFALAAAPVCNALHDRCVAFGARKVVTLHDISQLQNPDAPRTDSLAKEVGAEGLIMLYAGNLEPYQGVDLLLEAFALAARETNGIDLVVVGGIPKHIEDYRQKAADLGIAERAHFLGPRPIEVLDRYLADSDILVAPRIRGINTPMKVFAYLHSGRPVLVTDLPTHSQVLTREVAMLAHARPAPFAEAILHLERDPELRERLGREGRAFVEGNHTFESHKRRVDKLYDWIEAELAVVPAIPVPVPDV
jgi:glycosyltransferase involved in cell wall biosynthesis